MENKKFLSKKLICLIVLLLILVLLAVVVACNRSAILDVIQGKSNLPDTQKKVDTSTWDSSKVTIAVDDDGYKVPIPKGYVASGASDEDSVENGFVIYEGTARVTDTNKEEQQKLRNQWVWIPVEDPSRMYEIDRTTGKIKSKLYDYSETGRTARESYEPQIIEASDTEITFNKNNLQGLTQDEFLEKLEVELGEIIKSIEKYGGFFIARYETGDVSTSLPCSERANEDAHVQNWYDVYFNQKSMAANENVMTGMIWGFLYDETLQWLVDIGNKTYKDLNSYGWGRYGRYVNNIANAPYQGYLNATATGSSDDWKACNIYDLSGNWAEWTVEADSTYNRRWLRGRLNGYDVREAKWYRNLLWNCWSRGSSF